MTSQTSDSPVCDCHGEPMRWRTDRRLAKGGHWTCVQKRRARNRRYDATPAGRDRKKRWRRARIAAGLCTKCGRDVLITETRCFDCAGKHDQEVKL